MPVLSMSAHGMHPFLPGLQLRLLERLRPSDFHVNLALAIVVGIGGSLATVGFREMLDLLRHAMFGPTTGLVEAARTLPWWHRIWVPAVGGALAGLVLTAASLFDKDRKSVDYIEAITIGDGHIAARPSLLRAISSMLSVVSGASIGREAPMVQLAALIGALLGRWRNTVRQRRRLLVACGAAAGICSAYNAPIAGALFVAEIVLQSLAIEMLAPLIVSSAIANLVTHHFLGFAPLYRMPAFELRLGLDAGAFALLGIVAGLAAPPFLWIIETAKRPYGRMCVPQWIKLALGGLIVGAISAIEPSVWGNGYSVVNSIMQGGWLWQALLLVLLLKILATAVATGSGAVGGVFTPTLFVGASLGALFGVGLHAIWPAASPLPAYIAAGMGAFLAASTHASLMSVIMIFEMTGNPQIIVPLLLACVLGVTVKRIFMERSIYAHARQPAIVRSKTARDLLRRDPPILQEHDTPARAEEVFLARRWQHAYMVDASNRFMGALSLHDFGPFLRANGAACSDIPITMVRTDYPRVQLDSSLGEMLEAFTLHAGERLPVIDHQGVLQGYVSKTDVMLALQEGTPTK